MKLSLQKIQLAKNWTKLYLKTEPNYTYQFVQWNSEQNTHTILRRVAQIQ